MRIRHGPSQSAQVLAVGGQTYQAIEPDVFDVPYEVADFLLAYPDWEAVEEVQPQATDAQPQVAETAPDAQASDAQPQAAPAPEAQPQVAAEAQAPKRGRPKKPGGS